MRRSRPWFEEPAGIGVDTSLPHPARRRALRVRGLRSARRDPLHDRGQLRFPPASTATSRPTTRWTSATWRTAVGCRCWRSRARGTPISRPPSLPPSTRRWVDIDDPDPTSRTPRASWRRPRTTTPSPRRRPGAGPGGGRLLAARGLGLRPRRRVLLLHPGRWPARARTERLGAGWGNGSGQIWGYHTRLKVAPAGLRVAGARHARLSGQHHHPVPEDVGAGQGQRQRQLPARIDPAGRLSDIALNRLSGTDGSDRFNDEFAGVTFSPDGQTLFVNIQSSRGMSFAIWGPWPRIGVR